MVPICYFDFLAECVSSYQVRNCQCEDLNVRGSCVKVRMPCQHWGLCLHGEVNSCSLPVVGSSIAAQLTFAVSASIHFYMFYSGPSYFCFLN